MHLTRVPVGIDHDLEDSNGESATDYVLFDGWEPSQRGLELVAEIAGFRATFYEDFDEIYPELVTECQERFSTQAVMNDNGQEVDWLVHNFKGFPSIAVMTRLSQFQANINYLREELLLKEEE